MEPIPQTLEALDEIETFSDGSNLFEQLTVTAERARQVAPGLVGVSVASREHGITFTLIATDEEIAKLDAVQYLVSGPCVDAMDMGHGIATSPEGLLSESRWQDFASASAAAGVSSTLTFPVIVAGDIVATVNLYGRAADTFADKHQSLAEVFGAWAPGVVANADLSFSTRAAAEKAPSQLREAAAIDTATGILAAQRELTVAAARAQLDEAARRAGVPIAQLAAVVVRLRRES